MSNKIVIGENEELRGFRVRLYPSVDQLTRLDYLAVALRGVWNTLVKFREEADDAACAMAVKTALVRARPVPPDYDGLLPEVSAAAAVAHRDDVRAWYREVREVTDDVPKRTLRDLVDHLGGGKREGSKKWDYQALQRIAAWHGHDLGAHLLQKLAKDYQTGFVKGRRPPRFKRAADPMPIGVRSGLCFSLGDYGRRGNCNNWYNCQVSLDGMKIRGRLPGRAPGGRVLEGVSIRREAGDQWYASVKVVVPKRVLPPAVPGSVVGIDVGLDNIAAIVNGPGTSLVPTSGVLIGNPRTREWDERVESMKDLARDSCDDRLMRRTAREEARMTRRVRHEIYNRILKPLETAEVITVEELPGRIGQMGGSRKVSVMRTVYRLLKERYGDRVREVPAAFTSQDCSQCGERSKESWAYGGSGMGNCQYCGHSEHRDINAARNVALKYVESIKNTFTL